MKVDLVKANTWLLMYLIPLGLSCLQPHNPTAFNALGLVGHMLFIKHEVERMCAVVRPCRKTSLTVWGEERSH